MLSRFIAIHTVNMYTYINTHTHADCDETYEENKGYS